MVKKFATRIFLFCIVIVFLTYFVLVSKQNSKLSGSKNISKSQTADLDYDGNLEKYHLINGRLKITQDNKIIWQSQSDWWVDDFVLADSNNDGTSDLNLSVWKKGNFGPDKPFWVKENDQSIKNHFFIFALNQGKVRAVWQSSNLEAPNCEFHFNDVDSDGKAELVTIEGVYTDNRSCIGEYSAVWKWNGWGFTKI